MLAERQHDEARAVLNIRRIRVERQESGARVLAQQERERGADGGVGETGQRLGRRNDVPDAADVGKRNQKRRLRAWRGASAGMRSASCSSRRESERLNERVERFAGRALEQPDEPRRVFLNQRPQVRRMIGEAEKDIARPAAFEFGLKLRGRTTSRAAPRGGGALRPARKAAAPRRGSQRALRSFKTRSAGASD